MASDKHALRLGETATFAIYTSFVRGLNGIMVDIARLPAAVLDAASFEFRVGNTPDPSDWLSSPVPDATGGLRPVAPVVPVELSQPPVF
jgi:hypothetical protein